MFSLIFDAPENRHELDTNRHEIDTNRHEVDTKDNRGKIILDTV